MIFRDFRYVSAEAAYRGVKNVDFISPLFAMARRGDFYITFAEQFMWTYMRFIYSFRQKIYKEEMTHG